MTEYENDTDRQITSMYSMGYRTLLNTAQYQVATINVSLTSIVATSCRSEHFGSKSSS